jgi:hypothetical protein
MGRGTYSSVTRSVRADSLGYHTKSANELFQSGNINNAMDPHGLVVREARDSEDHPNSYPLIVGLDVTGSMGSIPHYLLKEGMDDMVQGIIDNGISDPQLLFLGVGDHTCDKAPLQVGQFESSDELLDHWLTTVWLEGRGGGNDGESYMLAWYLAAYYTSIDSLEKRGKKGLLFTIGDEPCLMELSESSQKALMGPGQYQTLTTPQILEAAREKYDVIHLHMRQTRSGSRAGVAEHWRELIGDSNLIVVDRQEEVGHTIRREILRRTPNDGIHRVVRV